MLAPPNKTDVFVVGGGPAGLAAAIAARQRGFDVVVADAARPPIDKACGEGLMPESIRALRALGVAFDPEQSFNFRGVRFVDGPVSVEANFPEASGIGVRRTCLHGLLVDRASEIGVSFLWGARVTGVSKDGVTVDGNAFQCRWVVGADGQKSRVRAWAGLDRARHESIRYGFRRHYQMPPWTDQVEVHWGLGCQVYVTPVAPQEVSVALLCDNSHMRIESALSYFPELNRRLAGAPFSSSERGAVTASRRLHNVVRGKTLLIGDASGSVDAITGEGLCLSFRQAVALADALSSGDLVSYQAEHRRLAQRPILMSRLLLLLDRFPRLRRRALGALAARPAIFAQLLAMHVGAISSMDFLKPLPWREALVKPLLVSGQGCLRRKLVANGRGSVTASDVERCGAGFQPADSLSSESSRPEGRLRPGLAAPQNSYFQSAGTWPSGSNSAFSK